MKLTAYSIQKLKEIISGDLGLTPYQSGSNLVALFNSFGSREVYNGSLPDGLSRNKYAEKKLLEINETDNLTKIIEFIVSPAYFNGSELDAKEAVHFINQIINEEKYNLSLIGGAYQITGNIAEAKQEVKNQVHFEQIQKQILAELDKARFTIWIAVAWFTDPVLFSKLIEKKKQGLNVQILIINDAINSRSGIDFESHFQIIRLKPTGYFGNITHHKFCVIDLERVINGSYNWTVKAQYNDENITIMEDRRVAQEFAEKFLAIKTE
ncbi:phospholipase D-like domain-containing protein [Flavobacterium notoginsengisoli]|uniref:phospholipase D-like domain-containing protein n=1 Tax=Flavobacterium notoginsengisoli TaxID=1478199 RepID=UPI00363DD7A5